MNQEYKFNINIDNIYTIYTGKSYEKLILNAPFTTSAQPCWFGNSHMGQFRENDMEKLICRQLRKN